MLTLFTALLIPHLLIKMLNVRKTFKHQAAKLSLLSCVKVKPKQEVLTDSFIVKSQNFLPSLPAQIIHSLQSEMLLTKIN